MGNLTSSAAVGFAVGGRSSAGIAIPVLAATRGRRGAAAAGLRAIARVAVLAELVGDKLPTTPSRLETRALTARVGAGAVGALALAVVDKRSAGQAVVATVAGAAGAFAGSHAGAAWRSWAADSGPDWLSPDAKAAAVEDAVVLGLVAAASRG